MKILPFGNNQMTNEISQQTHISKSDEDDDG